MSLTAIFESWHIGDGNYPPLNEGQLVDLSFELEPRKSEEVSLGVPESFEHLGKGEYRFCGTALKSLKTPMTPLSQLSRLAIFGFTPCLMNQTVMFKVGDIVAKERSCLTTTPGLNISADRRIHRTCSITLRSSES